MLLGLIPFIHPRLLACARKDPGASNKEERVSKITKSDILAFGALFSIQGIVADELLFVLINCSWDGQCSWANRTLDK